MPLPRTSMDKVMKGVDQVARDIDARDEATVDAFNRKTAAFKTSLGGVPAYPEDYGKNLSSSELVGAADAARRLHERGNLYGGLGKEDYDVLQKVATSTVAKSLKAK